MRGTLFQREGYRFLSETKIVSKRHNEVRCFFGNRLSFPEHRILRTIHPERACTRLESDLTNAVVDLSSTRGKNMAN